MLFLARNDKTSFNTYLDLDRDQSSSPGIFLAKMNVLQSAFPPNGNKGLPTIYLVNVGLAWEHYGLVLYKLHHAI